MGAYSDLLFFNVISPGSLNTAVGFREYVGLSCQLHEKKISVPNQLSRFKWSLYQYLVTARCVGGVPTDLQGR